MAAVIAEMVRELRTDAMPDEAQALRAAALWAVGEGFAVRGDFTFADLPSAAGWSDLPVAAAALLLRTAVKESAAARRSYAVVKAAAASAGSSGKKPAKNLYDVIALASLELEVKQLPNASKGPKAAITTLVSSLEGQTMSVRGMKLPGLRLCVAVRREVAGKWRAFCAAGRRLLSLCWAKAARRISCRRPSMGFWLGAECLL